MEFRFRSGDRRPRRPSLSSSDQQAVRAAWFSLPCDRRFTRRGKHHRTELERHHDFPPLTVSAPRGPPPFEWEAAARREWIIREEVERRLIEERIHRDRERSLSRAWLHGGSVPPPPGPFFGAGPSMPPTPMPMGMQPNWPMPMDMQLNWPPPDSFGPRRRAEVGQWVFLGEQTRLRPPPKQKKLELREIEPSESSEVLSWQMKVLGVKRKADVIAAATKPTEVQEADAYTEPIEVRDGDTETIEGQEAVADWSCALCQVSATSQAGLNEHLRGKKHRQSYINAKPSR